MTASEPGSAMREALNRIADLGSCAGGKRPVHALFQDAIDIATSALSAPLPASEAGEQSAENAKNPTTPREPMERADTRNPSQRKLDAMTLAEAVAEVDRVRVHLQRLDYRGCYWDANVLAKLIEFASMRGGEVEREAATIERDKQAWLTTVGLVNAAGGQLAVLPEHVADASQQELITSDDPITGAKIFRVRTTIRSLSASPDRDEGRA